MASTLIDVREYAEFATGHITGSRLVPLASLAVASGAWDRGQPLTLICRSGKRAEQARVLLSTRGFSSLTVLPGGIDEWTAAGKPLAVQERRPWSLERQVRVVAGSLVVVTLGLGWLVSPYFLVATAFVGCGLVFAGVSDICMMATLLGRMRWNRAPQQTLK